ILSFFMQAPMQLIENFAFEYSKIARQSYGKIRSFGSLGYAIAGYFGGYLTHQFGLPIIFIVFSFTFLIPLLFVYHLPNIETPHHLSQNESGLYKQLFSIKEYKSILILSFLMIGSTSSMSTFFGIYIQNYAGLDLKFLGLTILLSAGSEVPMMFVSDKIINRIGAYRVLMLASFFTFLRFVVYVFLPSKFWITLVSLTHGIGYGSGYTALMHLIEKHIPTNIRSIAISFNATFAIGFGTFVIISFVSFLLNAHNVFMLLASFEAIAFVYASLLYKKELDTLCPTH
ncbi:MAG TPA: MFS transporter, partial [Erysipelothrix sp.]|nr:MFS transporter [Erysipelothrix sp.]